VDGPAVRGVLGRGLGRPEATRLAELHASAIEDHAAELIGARRWPEAIAGLKAHVSVHPLRDRPWGLLVQALGGAGRQADALAAFREYRAYLAEWTGTEPSAEVDRIQQRITAGWAGTEETPPPSSRGNDWLPLQAELVRGPVVIGRAREVELLAAETVLAGASGARTVIVEGEAGIGKTTVLGAFARAVRDKGSAAVLYGRCQDGPAVPLEPFRSLIGHVVEHAPADVLRAHTARCGGHLVRIAPRLASRVELAGHLGPAGHFEQAGRAELARTGVSDATERHLLFEAVSDLLTRLAAISPLVVVLDDVQWAEPTAVQFLRHLGRALVNAPVLLVLLARDTDERRPRELRAALAELERRPGRRICLGGFGDDELAGLTASLLAVDAGAVTPAVCARLHEQSAGNPLYAIQLVRHWAESGQLAVAAAGVDFAMGAAVDEVPASLRNLIWSRVSSLGDEVLAVLSAAAVLGTQFDAGAVIDMAGISESDAMDALDVAEAAGLLTEVGARAGTLRFVHVLVARAVYAGLPRGRRKRLHAQAAQVLAKQAGPPAMYLAAQVARQYALGAMPEQARHWAITAGDYAAGQLSPAEAARWYLQALTTARPWSLPAPNAPICSSGSATFSSRPTIPAPWRR
jgi:predicted ATPase